MLTSVPVTLNLKPLAPVELHVQILWASLEDEACSITYSVETSTVQSVDAGDYEFFHICKIVLAWCYLLHFCKGPNLKYFLFKFLYEPPSPRHYP